MQSIASGDAMRKIGVILLSGGLDSTTVAAYAISEGYDLISLIEHWSVSPKLQNSGNSQSMREVEACYRLFNNLNSSHFKYVLQSEADFEEAHKLVQKYNLDSKKLILMPEAGNKGDLMERSKWLVELCKSQGYMFSTRLHLLLWGNERGK